MIKIRENYLKKYQLNCNYVIRLKVIMEIEV